MYIEINQRETDAIARNDYNEMQLDALDWHMDIWRSISLSRCHQTIPVFLPCFPAFKRMFQCRVRSTKVIMVYDTNH